MASDGIRWQDLARFASRLKSLMSFIISNLNLLKLSGNASRSATCPGKELRTDFMQIRFLSGCDAFSCGPFTHPSIWFSVLYGR